MIQITRLLKTLTLSVFSLALVALTACAGNVKESNSVSNGDSRARMLVLTDIEADPDDAQTLVRLLLYANEIDLQGLVATTSVHQQTMVAPESIHTIIDAYEKVYPTLSQHAPDYPTANELRALVSQGLPTYGMQGVGPGHDSQGSEKIIELLENDDERPLWISVWGGPNTLAQALYKLRETRSDSELKRLVSKLRVYTISDQDDSAAWMRENFPNLFYIVSPGGYGAATWTGISTVVDGFDNTTISNQWLANNIQQNHGPLGAQYPDVAYGVEGDTPSWLNLIPNGLNTPERPDWGGWGGRYERYVPELSALDPEGFTGGVPVEAETRPIWTNANDTYEPHVYSDFGRSLEPLGKTFEGYRVTLWRWRDEFQNDFAARMDWTTKPYEEANHPPVPALNHAERLTVSSGSYYNLDARNSFDPDGDSLQFLWLNYPEVGTMPTEPVNVDSADNMARVHMRAPEVEQPQELHYILKVTDRGSPRLTRYKRVIVEVTPD
ncbi:DUF1593 domain-containing protein [Gilvimarinus sp. SDUM040013]|uniref:DUF1593 domain-containing protein n=1 Tax=Gilvimarinus gilvus TaxID=3058038 RepID=A0ABU4S0N0_9GAMM|nr:nucleoside hydrolase-like domain-containing protein [Gilvimarinus sp. SDUM040013]MDO3385637.1 DUF1593 domain-containing protein [Gilvimarinus sp. SDUM040013]MDX6849971.1 DUF1593 domain-containing protein [Gilvimarinus sp. SDUM040013]